MVRTDASARQRELLVLLLSGLEPREAGATLGLSERTVRRYLADPGFAEELRAASATRVRALSNRAMARAQTALDKLADLAENDAIAPAVQARACLSLINVSIRFYEVEELADRVARLEAAMQDEG